MNHDLTGVRAYDGKDASMPTFFVQGIEKQNEFLCKYECVEDMLVSRINRSVVKLIDIHAGGLGFDYRSDQIGLDCSEPQL